MAARTFSMYAIFLTEAEVFDVDNCYEFLVLKVCLREDDLWFYTSVLQGLCKLSSKICDVTKIFNSMSCYIKLNTIIVIIEVRAPEQ